MNKCCLLFLYSCLFIGAVKAQNFSVEHFTVNNIIYVKDFDGKSVSLAQWDWESGISPTGHIEIPARVSYQNKEYIVKYIQSSAFYDSDDLVSITLPSTIESIGSYAFYGCKKLEAIKIPNSVTDIGAGAFCFCFSLKSIVLPSSLRYIEEETFRGCPFMSITIPNSVVGIEAGAFDGCEELTNITLSNSLQVIGIGAFDGCKQLSSITLPKTVSLIGDIAFRGCDNLTSIFSLKEKKIIDVKSISNYYQTFQYYDSPMGKVMLRTIEDGNALQVCGVAEELYQYYIPSVIYEEPNLYVNPDDSVKTLVVTSIADNVFVNNNIMEELYIPASIKKISTKAFSGCNKLKKIFIPIGSMEHFKSLLPISFSSKLEEMDFSKIDYYRITNIKPIMPCPQVVAGPPIVDYSKVDAVFGEFNESQDSDHEHLKEEELFDDDFCTQMPEIQGGYETIQNLIKYPKDAKKLGIEGCVIVMLDINKDGSVDNVKVGKGLFPSLDREAVRVASKLKFIPGRNKKGAPIKVSFNIPVRFSLNNN